MAKISKITLPNEDVFDIRASAIPYAQVDSTSTATAYTATVPGVTELTDGVCVILRNGVVTSASGFTINVNGLGAKPSYSNMATGNETTPTAPTRETTIFNINYTMIFVYSSDVVEGGCWICYRGYDANTNTIGYQLRTNSMSLPMSSVTYRYRLLFTSADGTHFVPANNSTSTNATAKRNTIQEKIDPFGRIVYYGTTASVAAGSRPAATALWLLYTLSLGYSFNRTGAALTLTSWKPVYLKCAPQSDGSAIIEAETPYVQNLPTTEDGKIYILLGVAYSATNIELFDSHPVYYFKDGAVRAWTNTFIPTKTSDLTNDSGFLTSYTETDPTVPAWAKASTKPTYTASEVGALPDTTTIPTVVSDLTNDSGFITANDVPTELFIVNVTLTSETGGTSNKTAIEIKNAAESGKLPIVMLSFNGASMVAPLTFAASTDGDDVARFTYIDQNNNTVFPYAHIDILGNIAILQAKTSLFVMQSELPTKTSDLTNDSGFIDNTFYSPGNGISITNGVISLDLANANNISY